jgi:hypothetical protein
MKTAFKMLYFGALLAVLPLRASACTAMCEYAWANVEIPEVPLTNATLPDVVDLLNKAFAKSLTNQPSAQATLSPAVARAVRDHEENYRVTFHGRHVRVGCFIKIIAAVAGLRFAAGPAGCVFVVAPEENEPMQVHSQSPKAPDKPAP